jgi:type II secretory pathway pseudopilin PulG
MRRYPVIAALLGAALLAASSASARQDNLAAARQATAAYHDVGAAMAAGYGEFRDAQNIACIENQPLGTMGIHYVNGGLVGDAVVNAVTPEALVYEPKAGGGLNLVALEYIVFQSAWDASHASPPTLFGHEFGLVSTPNRYGLPPFYELHVWLWQPNPSGMFFEWNPRVHC